MSTDPTNRKIRVRQAEPAMWVHTGRSATGKRYAVLTKGGNRPYLLRTEGHTDAQAEARLQEAACRLEDPVVDELVATWHDHGLASFCGLLKCRRLAEHYDGAGVGWCWKHRGDGL